MDVVLYWNPLTLGDRTLSISLDPSDEIEEINEEDNEQTVAFPVLQRPQGVDLAFREGAIRTEPPVPRPNEQFLITARVDNLGSSDATELEATLEIRNDIGRLQNSNGCLKGWAKDGVLLLNSSLTVEISTG